MPRFNILLFNDTKREAFHEDVEEVNALATMPPADWVLWLDRDPRQCPGRSGNIHSVHLLYTDEAGPQWHQRSLIIQDWG